MESDEIQTFLKEAAKIAGEARLVVDSLPNIDIFAAERSIRQLSAIQVVLVYLEDGFLDQERKDELSQYAQSLIDPLNAHLSSRPPPRNIGTTTIKTGRRGRPAYSLDLERAKELHGMGIGWEKVADALGVTRLTLYNHFHRAGISTARPEWTAIEDDALDEIVSQITLEHPFIGSVIIKGHLEAMGIHLSPLRVQECLRRVDAIGVLIRWSGIIKRRIYRVRGSNALWHQDGNEKLKPWGFWVHGCIDGHSRLLIYLVCCNNKRSDTVRQMFLEAIHTYGWPSRVRGDFGTENNGIEAEMIAKWGEAHRAYLRGRSVQNIRMERTWRDVRKDCLEAFRETFLHMEGCGLLDMENEVHHLVLYLVYQPRIQASLDRSKDAWNLHKIRTAGNLTPLALYELSREKAINRGYWTGDPGDDINDASDPLYGCDGDAPLASGEEDTGRDDGADVPNNQDALHGVQNLLEGIDLQEEDGNWGIDVFCRAVVLVFSKLGHSETSSEDGSGDGSSSEEPSE